MKKKNLTASEEKLLIGFLYNHVSFGMTMEVAGELESAGIDRLNSMRGIFGKLLVKYGLEDALDDQTYLLLGMSEFISDEFVQKAAANDKNKHLQNRAKYLLSKPARKVKQ